VAWTGLCGDVGLGEFSVLVVAAVGTGLFEEVCGYFTGSNFGSE
jgi:hypothetical protein